MSEAPPVMSATSGPVEFYWNGDESPVTGRELASGPPPLQSTLTFPETTRSVSKSPVRKQLRSATNPAINATRTLNNVKSTPALVPSRPSGTVKHIANRLNQAGAGAGSGQQPQLTVQTTHDRVGRPGESKSPTRKSPTKEGATKLQKRRPGRPPSPVRSPGTSFGTSNSSFSSTGTITSTKSQQHAALSLKKQHPYVSARPLFGEITADGRWNGNFDLGNYGSLPTSHDARRRSSDGNVAVGHTRSQSHEPVLQPASTTALLPPRQPGLSHRRSRSEMDAHQPQTAPSMPNLQTQHLPGMYPTPPHLSIRNALRKPSPTTSRIPVSNRRQSSDSGGPSSGPHSRSASAMSNHAGRNRLSKSPTRKTVAGGIENSKPSGIPRSRYNPPPVSNGESNQLLSAKIVPPPPKLSPPLRSSRPRQPVSSATTSASRARAAERFQGAATRDGRRPSEQWLGKPYDPQNERSKRKIPELGAVDFAERRARIQRAISQNLEDHRSLESLRSRSRQGSGSRSRKMSEASQMSHGPEVQAGADADSRAQNFVDLHQADEFNREADTMPGGWPTPGGLSVDTFQVPDHASREPEPSTALTSGTAGTVETEFELDESPVLGRPSTQESKPPNGAIEEPTLLTPARYQPPARKASAPPPIAVAKEAPAEEVQSPSVLENVMQMRQKHSPETGRSGDSEFVEESPTAEDSPNDLEDLWGLGNALNRDHGSIKIMLDGEPQTLHQPDQPWPRGEFDQYHAHAGHGGIAEAQSYNHQAYAANGYTVSPVQEDFTEEQRQGTPRKNASRDDTLKPSIFQPSVAFSATSENIASDPSIARALEQYQSRGIITAEMLKEMQKHVVDLQRASANEGSNGFMIQSLLDSVLSSQHSQEQLSEEPEEPQQATLPSSSYEVPPVTPDTPPDWEYTEAGGTAVVYRSSDTSFEGTPENEKDEEDFHEKIRKADEAWERQQRGEYAMGGVLEDEDRPPPPPKDIGYTPRSSTGPNSATFPPDLSMGLRISTKGHLDLPGVQPTEDDVEITPMEHEQVSSPVSAPPRPSYAPPAPPSATVLPFGLRDLPQIQATAIGTHSERDSSEMSPRVRKNLWGPSGSSRPSIDSQRAPGPPPLPGSTSMSSFADSTRQTSIDTGAENQTTLSKTTSPGPEQKRLLKRRHIIKELLDTENTYHQDLKIIEDIYKATAVSDLISLEDKKVLFGNCDEIERFSLLFYDDLRKAVAPIYVPAKQLRWMNKRGSYSTTQSDGTGQNSMMTADGVDDEKDRATTVGQAFLQNLQRMEHLYSSYLKNHDAANQRLSALRTTPTVKCWLDECHKNASDITSAWDLDSLLVKPTQRVAKYPMLLQQLLETTPQNHPDREALSNTAKDSVSMLTRINEAKKRADLVDQIVNRKRKDSDVRSGIAKAFGRRTEKLKERVGIAEAFQDPDFDELAHKFGGHFIRLQICMRDVQDYVHRIDKSVDQINNCAGALDLFTDVSTSSLPEIESKWRKYGQAIREITAISFVEHRAAVQKRVIAPMVACIKLHEGPQNAINKRKKRIVDYAKCKSIEKRGEKPDRKITEASEMYEALNDQLKIELPKLYGLTASLVQGCLNCFLEIQLIWHNTWERKLRPVLEAADIPTSTQQIEPAFHPDFDMVGVRLDQLGICNGAVLAESSNFLSPTTTLMGDSEPTSARRPSTFDSSKRTMSVGSDTLPMPGSATYKRRSSGYIPTADTLNLTHDGRMRSNSSLSHRGTPTQMPGSGMSANRQWSNVNTPTSSFSASRPTTASTPSTQQTAYGPPRQSAEQPRSPRPMSSATYFTAKPDQPDNVRFSGIFSSAMPSDTPDSTRPASPMHAPADMPVLFVCASLFEFSIDKTRKEGGYPYLTYVQGEVFDVIAQKGELWLAKNQDDSTNTLGWIWEQHFVILSQD